MKIKSGYMLRKICNEAVVIAIGSTDFNGMLKLNDTGAYLWEQMQGEFNTDTVKNALLQKYEISESEAEQGANDFIKTLSDVGVIDYE